MRSATHMAKDFSYYGIRLIIYIGVVICIGTIYYDVGTSYNSILARGSCLAFVFGFVTFMSIGGFPSFVEKMKVFQRERLNGHYGVAAFVVSNKISDDSSPPSSSSKRLVARKTIQTNFGNDYVFQIALSPNENKVSALAVSLSSNLIKLYSPETGQYVGEYKGHTGTIHEIAFSMPSFLCSCSSDGTVRAWDTRAAYKQVSLFQPLNPKQSEIFSFCIGGSSSSLLAAGCMP